MGRDPFGMLGVVMLGLEAIGAAAQQAWMKFQGGPGDRSSARFWRWTRAPTTPGRVGVAWYGPGVPVHSALQVGTANLTVASWFLD